MTLTQWWHQKSKGRKDLSMKKFLFCLLALCLANIPATLHAATPVPPMDSVIIENFTPQEIQRVIAMYVPNWGWCPEEANEFKMTFSRKETDIGASILFGSRFNSTPESRVTFYFSYTETGNCLLYTSDAADEEDSVDLGGRRINKKKKNKKSKTAQ
eukprot:TRINITY_DN10211_c0_g1_i2.p1 TRINITY_DN10211_c0_g1~~TRINITY_DN10211_c0_g1_i2.p1  ORF type:complete len:157 (+),score=16.91 TRINITY_DN10211_c0_g1_i2:227-697(+)